MNNQLVPQNAAAAAAAAAAANSLKSRKPYTISKQRENWTDEEHQKFLEALTLFDRDWKKIESFVGSKTVIQIRSHAQKYFIKVQKNNTGERIPPPRPKRKSIQPYPQKQKHDGMGAFIPDSLSGNHFISSSSFATWMTYRGLMPNISESQINPSDLQKQLEQLQQAQQYIQQAVTTAQNSQRNGGLPPNPQSNNGGTTLTPNFPKIYAFLSNLFESNGTSFTEALSDLSMIDRETMQILMHNLAINLANQQYRDNHQTLSEQYRMKRDEDEDLNAIMISPRNSTGNINVSGDFYDNSANSGNSGGGGGGGGDYSDQNHSNMVNLGNYYNNHPNQNTINALYSLQNQTSTLSNNPLNMVGNLNPQKQPPFNLNLNMQSGF
ncbi:hypothetical protein ACTA71_001002 [Dictyostelium dimigraforme]